MAGESPRIIELRRRVEADPASSAFAQLAEEYRRSGDYQQAVACCRAGLARHPGYLAARVTLGRSLLELGRLDEAAPELENVLRVAHDNLPALRAMAEIQQQRGDLTSALEYYKRALALARFDTDLEETVARIDEQLDAARRPGIVDFDALLRSMGVPDAAPPPGVERLMSRTRVDPAPPIVPDVAGPPGDDPFAGLETDLRAFARARNVRDDQHVLDELEAWLRAVAAARVRSSGQ